MAVGTDFILVQLAAIFLAAKIGGYLASVVRAPPLVGEILAGAVVANTALAGPLHLTETPELLQIFAELGVIFLIFTVGLETDLGGLLRVGRVASTTAMLGVAVPFVAGAGLFLALGHTTPESAFMGVALVATSVGITARVLSDLGVLQSTPARIILGAAVIDDVLGLLLLTMVSAVVARGAVSTIEIGLIVLSAAGFFLVASLVGRGIIRFTIGGSAPSGEHRWAGFLREQHFPVILAILLCLGLSALATQFGLAAIIGAFLAGILFDRRMAQEELGHSMEAITELLAPFFFAVIGLSLPLQDVVEQLPLILAVTAVAVLTKVIGCGLGALPAGRASALAVGIGMVPRGEVGIIVALLGLQLGIVQPELYTVVVGMSVLTTLLAPPLLVLVFRRLRRPIPTVPAPAPSQP